jgi:hypothetical protein
MSDIGLITGLSSEVTAISGNQRLRQGQDEAYGIAVAQGFRRDKKHPITGERGVI